MKKVLITGASGLVGQAVSERLAAAGYRLRAAQRTQKAPGPYFDEQVIVGDIALRTDWRAALDGVDLVVHAAARTHVVPGSAEELDCQRTNADGSESLARAAVQAGVRRLVYLSTVKVNGEYTTDRPFAATDVPDPKDPYASSKLLGEVRARTVIAGTSLELTTLRLPLIYGPGVRANFLRLLDWVQKRRPLPFAAVHNARSLLSVWNLSDFVARVLEHPRAAGTWMLSDGRDLSTPELLRLMGSALGCEPRLFAVPVGVLRAAGALLGLNAQMSRLCGSLVVDITPARTLLGWQPPLSVEESLARTARWYQGTRLAHAA